MIATALFIVISTVSVLAKYIYNSKQTKTVLVPETVTETSTVPDVSNLSIDELLGRRAVLSSLMCTPGDETCDEVIRAHMFNLNARINALALPGSGYDGSIHFNDNYIKKSYERLM
jgi:hypothetical protein